MIRRNRSGFTLIELIIVVGIISILVVVLLAVLLAARTQGDAGKVRNFLNNVLPSALTQWQQDNGKGANEFPHSGMNREKEYYDGNALLYDELVTKPMAAGKRAYIMEDQYVKAEHPGPSRQFQGKPLFGDAWSRPYIYRNYLAKRTREGGDVEYRGKRYNDTFDMISAGEDGQFGTEDDIYNGK